MMTEGHKIDFMTPLGIKVSFMFDLILAVTVPMFTHTAPLVEIQLQSYFQNNTGVKDPDTKFI
jgi:hypothetical protein